MIRDPTRSAFSYHVNPRDPIRSARGLVVLAGLLDDEAHLVEVPRLVLQLAAVQSSAGERRASLVLHLLPGGATLGALRRTDRRPAPSYKRKVELLRFFQTAITLCSRISDKKCLLQDVKFSARHDI